MSEKERMRLFWIVAGSVSLLAVTLVMTAGGKCALPDATAGTGRCGNPLSNWLYDFQSLIAGVFAVIAAYVTVHQMRRTDSEQQTRHDEVFALHFRENQLSISQALGFADKMLLPSGYIFADFSELDLTTDDGKKVCSKNDTFFVGQETNALIASKAIFLKRSSRCLMGK